jgi:hypothetical protein
MDENKSIIKRKREALTETNKEVGLEVNSEKTT